MKFVSIKRVIQIVLLIIAALLLAFIYWFSDYTGNMVTKSWSFGRYRAYDVFYAFVDRYRGIGIEPRIYAYEYRSPFIYVIGKGGFTKILNNPIITHIEKTPYVDGYHRGPDIKVSKADDNLEDMKKVYGDSLIIYNHFSEYDRKDQEVFISMMNELEAKKEQDFDFLWSLMSQ